MKRSIPVTILRYSNSMLVSQGIGIMGCHRKATASISVKHFSCDKSIIPSVSSCVRFRPAYDFVLNFSKDDLNRLVSSWNLRTDDIKSSVQQAPPKTSSVRPETLDDRRHGTMPTLHQSMHLNTCCPTMGGSWRRSPKAM